MASQRIMSFTKLALAEFAETYGDLKEQRGFEGPSADELFEMLAEEIIGESLTLKQYKPRDDEVVQTAKAVEDVSSVPVEKNDEETPDDEVSEAAPVVEEAPTPKAVEQANQAPKVTESKSKVPAKDLKKFTVKQTKTTKSGETKEVDVMVELPYLPHCVDYSGTCQAIKCNGGLMTPCLTRPAKGSSYCRICAKDMKYGTLADREAAPVGSYEVKCENGEKSQMKREITYGTWLMKRSMERSYVETLLQEQFGDAISIPESYFEVNKSKARRGVKKSPSVSSDGETSSVEEETASAEKVQKKRGRPKKEKSANAEEKPKKRRGRPAAPKKNVVEEETLESLEEENTASVTEPVPEPQQDAQQEPVTPPPAPTAEEEETQNTVVENAKSEPESQPQPQQVQTDELDEDEISDDDDDDEEDDTLYFMYKGKQMGYDEENTLFLIEETGPSIVGTWDPETEQPVFDEGKEL